MISLIITTYNYAQFVERAIRSSLEQTLPKEAFEVIVVDDASSDSTPAVLENYKEDVRYFRLEKNVGLAAARNFGIRKAKGQFVVFLDADDYIHRDLIRTQKLFLEENPKLDAISVDYYLVDANGAHIKHVSADESPIACGIMFRKDFLHQIGLYDESFRAREEEDLRIRWLTKFNIYNIILPLYRYRMHDANLTKNDDEMEKHREMLESKHRK